MYAIAKVTSLCTLLSQAIT